MYGLQYSTPRPPKLSSHSPNVPQVLPRNVQVSSLGHWLSFFLSRLPPPPFFFSFFSQTNRWKWVDNLFPNSLMRGSDWPGLCFVVPNIILPKLLWAFFFNFPIFPLFLFCVFVIWFCLVLVLVARVCYWMFFWFVWSFYLSYPPPTQINLSLSCERKGMSCCLWRPSSVREWLCHQRSFRCF